MAMWRHLEPIEKSKAIALREQCRQSLAQGLGRHGFKLSIVALIRLASMAAALLRIYGKLKLTTQIYHFAASELLRSYNKGEGTKYSSVKQFLSELGKENWDDWVEPIIPLPRTYDVNPAASSDPFPATPFYGPSNSQLGLIAGASLVQQVGVMMPNPHFVAHILRMQQQDEAIAARRFKDEQIGMQILQLIVVSRQRAFE